MEKIKLRYEAMQQSLRSLEKALVILEKSTEKDFEINKLMRDGTIQRFEYSIDGFWKFLKIYFEMNFKIAIESPSPKTILKLALDMQLISDHECMILLDAVSDRNLTSHTYDEDLADNMEQHIELYFITMKTIIERLGIE